MDQNSGRFGTVSIQTYMRFVIVHTECCQVLLLDFFKYRAVPWGSHERHETLREIGMYSIAHGSCEKHDASRNRSVTPVLGQAVKAMKCNEIRIQQWQ